MLLLVRIWTQGVFLQQNTTQHAQKHTEHTQKKDDTGQKVQQTLLVETTESRRTLDRTLRHERHPLTHTNTHIQKIQYIINRPVYANEERGLHMHTNVTIAARNDHHGDPQTHRNI